MDIDLEELKRKYAAATYFGQPKIDWDNAIFEAFPAIVAKLEAQDNFINQAKYELHRAKPDDLAANLLNLIRELRQ